MSPEHSLVGVMTEISTDFGVRVQINVVAPVKLFSICLFSVPADSTCDAPRKEEMETTYTDRKSVV